MIFKEPSGQTDLNGEHAVKRDGTTILLMGKGKHFEKLKKDLEDVGMIKGE
jgi:hypothetical protein